VEEDCLMDFVTLNAQNQAAKLIESYDKLVWTERFNVCGDFLLEAGTNIGGLMTALPEGTRVSLRDSNIAMVVETHEIIRKKNAPEVLQIKGRSFDSILDRRACIQSINSLTGSVDWSINLKTPSDLAYYVMARICSFGDISPLDVFPVAMVSFPAPSDYNTSTGPTKAFTVPRGNLLKVVQDLLATEAQADPTTTPATPAVTPHGLRAVRPSSAATAIALQIYPSTDKSGAVYFDATRDLLDDGRYLFSKVGSGNVAYGVASGLAATMYEGSSEPSGLDRRVILVDASQSSIASDVVLKNEMSKSLAAARETAIFDGSINQDLSPYVYGVDYNLGDIVKVKGDYGLYSDARVTEYIRYEGPDGVKSYPTLSAISA
jgi:hypothetical protein